MENAVQLLSYVTGPLQLAGLAILVLAGLVPRLHFVRDDGSRRALIWGLLGLGTLGLIGGIWIEAAKLSAAARTTAPEVSVTAGPVLGTDNAIGVGSTEVGAHGASLPRRVSVSATTVTGNRNAIGVGVVAKSFTESDQNVAR